MQETFYFYTTLPCYLEQLRHKQKTSSHVYYNLPLQRGGAQINVLGQLHKGQNQTRTSPEDSNTIRNNNKSLRRSEA